jgi:hypothetical protein
MVERTSGIKHLTLLAISLTLALWLKHKESFVISELSTELINNFPLLNQHACYFSGTVDVFAPNHTRTVRRRREHALPRKPHLNLKKRAIISINLAAI